MISSVSLQKAAFFTAIAHAGQWLLFVIADVLVLEPLLVETSLSQTGENMHEKTVAIKLSALAMLSIALLDVFVAWGLWIVTKSVNSSMAGLAAVLRISYASILAASTASLMTLTTLMTSTLFQDVSEPVINSSAVLLLQNFQHGWDGALIFVGLHLILVGVLLLHSPHFSSVVGYLTIWAGAGYTLDSVFEYVLSPESSISLLPYTFFGEPVLLVALLQFGASGKIPTVIDKRRFPDSSQAPDVQEVQEVQRSLASTHYSLEKLSNDVDDEFVSAVLAGLKRKAADHQLNDPLSEEMAADFESKYDAILPQDYHVFLTRCGNGGAGPGCGVHPLGTGLEGRIEPLSPEHPFRALPICEHGRGMQDLLIVSGPSAGQVWFRVVDGEAVAVAPYVNKSDGSRMNFAQYFLRWIDDALERPTLYLSDV